MRNQPAPIRNDRAFVQEFVINDMQERLVHGISTYGTGLQVGNSRDMIRDAYEEAMDLAVYLKGMQLMRDEIIKILTHVKILHHAVDDACVICNHPCPCHTVEDVDTVLNLLGNISH